MQVIFLLAVALVPGSAAFAEEGEDGCVAASGVRILDAAAHADYSATLDPETKTFKERVTLKDGTRVEVSVGGCEDYGIAVTLYPKSASTPLNAMGHWASFARDALSALSFKKAAKADIQELVAFLGKAGTLPTSKPSGGFSTQKEALQVERCRDGSAPGLDGCGSDTRGTLRLSVSRATASSTPKIILEHWTSLVPLGD
jgi:hypothetical protein